MEDRLSSIDSLSSTLPIPIIFFFSICTALAQHKFLIKLCVCDNTLVYNAIYGPARFGQINRLTILVKFTQFAAVAQIIIRKYSVRNCESRPTFRLSLSLLSNRRGVRASWSRSFVKVGAECGEEKRELFSVVQCRARPDVGGSSCSRLAYMNDNSSLESCWLCCYGRLRASCTVKGRIRRR